jgi:lanosterol synthase
VSSVLGTALNYVALRLLGVPAEDPVCVKARLYLHSLGGASGIPAWGKFWLAVLNVYDWEGVNPIPPELWCLPYTLNPIHPGRMWVHTRAVYLSMSYMYGLRFQAEETDLIKDLRYELYVSPYDKINWKSLRNHVSEVDLFAPHTFTLDVLNSLAGIYEKIPNSFLRKRALNVVLDHIKAEDRNTNFLDLGPVNIFYTYFR